LRFHNIGELRIYEALVRAQQRRPQEATVGILPGAEFRTTQRTFWSDFVITHRGRVGVIEVDGPPPRPRRRRPVPGPTTPRRRRHRHRRIMVEDLNQPAELDAIVERFLARLLTR